MRSISITGDLGSGKSTVAQVLSEKLNYEYFSTGNMQRKIAEGKGMNTLELNYFSEQNTNIDDYIDGFLKEINNSDTPYVLDSRLAWHFVNKSFKIYIMVDPLIAATRISSRTKRDGDPELQGINEIAAALLERQKVEHRRFKMLYNIDCGNKENYDLVVSSTSHTVEEIVAAILEAYNAAQ